MKTRWRRAAWGDVGWPGLVSYPTEPPWSAAWQKVPTPRAALREAEEKVRKKRRLLDTRMGECTVQKAAVLKRKDDEDK